MTQLQTIEVLSDTCVVVVGVVVTKSSVLDKVFGSKFEVEAVCLV